MRLSVFSVIAGASLAGGCASIVNGTSQVITVETHQSATPVSGASCEMANSKGTYHVTTPGSLTVHRAYGDLTVTCTKEGMPDGIAKVTSSTKPMVFGNILFGGAIGVVVDTTGGAAYDYPEVIRIVMGESIALKKGDAAPDYPAGAPAAGSALAAAAPSAVATPTPAPSATTAATTAPSSSAPVSINDLRYLLPAR